MLIEVAIDHWIFSLSNITVGILEFIGTKRSTRFDAVLLLDEAATISLSRSLGL